MLSVSDNQLVRLPEVPADLEALDVSNNQLTDVPESLLQLGHNAAVDLTNNPLQELLQTNLTTAMLADDYAGPQILFSLEPTESGPPPLHDVVADWVGQDPAAVAACSVSPTNRGRRTTLASSIGWGAQ
ncbi:MULTISPECIES: hypothetical protein [Bradyrhizobium]|uniref:hypothetical protein n=1 Tax=Bradyrhizobium TaxID=374 RepID=UPI001E2A29B4|nr:MULTISPECIES: hypothetical protein [Bradyrhizobium]